MISARMVISLYSLQAYYYYYYYYNFFLFFPLVCLYTANHLISDEAENTSSLDHEKFYVSCVFQMSAKMAVDS